MKGRGRKGRECFPYFTKIQFIEADFALDNFTTPLIDKRGISFLIK